MKSHSLSKLLKFIERNLELEISEETKDDIEKGDGYYFSTRYPGDNSIEVDEHDIRKARIALERARNLHMEIERLYNTPELSQEQTPEYEQCETKEEDLSR